MSRCEEVSALGKLTSQWEETSDKKVNEQELEPVLSTMRKIKHGR